MENTAEKSISADVTGESNERVDVEALMLEIRRRVKADLQDVKDRLPFYRPPASEQQNGRDSALLYSEELNYLNANWHDWSAPGEISSHRPIIGPVIVKLKRYIVKVVWNSLFKDYFERERQFQSNLVRFLNASARYIEKRDAEIFWQLVAKVDHEVAALNERLDRFYDETNATTRTVELSIAERLGALEADRNLLVELANRTHAEMSQLDDLIRGLERTVALIAKPISANGHSEASAEANGHAQFHKTADSQGRALAGFKDGVDYLLLENRYRGSEEVIKERLSGYLEVFRESDEPIVELGCGRGEFLELMRENNITALGVDIDQAMIARCREKGLSVHEEDALTYLESLADRSIGGVFAAQFVEHLSREQLERLLRLFAKKVRPEGKVVLETINPQSVTALCRNFFRDPTHIWPLHPDTLRFMMEMSGIKTNTILLKSPYPTEATLQPVEISPYLPARWRSTLEGMNDNIFRLNGLLFGHQDYAIVGII